MVPKIKIVCSRLYISIYINPCFRTSVVQIFTMSGSRVLDNLAGINGGFAWLAPIAILYSYPLHNNLISKSKRRYVPYYN